MRHTEVGLAGLALLAASGCGASVDGRDAPRDVVEVPEVATSVRPQKLADVPASGDTVALHLYVSNQSFDISRVDIDVWLQATHVVTGGFEVEGQHNWILFDLDVPAGALDLHAEALNGSVVIDEAVPVPDERWGILDFWYYPDDPAHPMFTWNLSEVPVAFQ